MAEYLAGQMRDRMRRLPLLGCRLACLIGVLVVMAACPDKKPEDPSCDGNEDCPEGQYCVNRQCLSCGDNSHCAVGQTCIDGTCFDVESDCQSDADCKDGEICRNGLCTRCQTDTDCGPGGSCVDGACQRPTECRVDEDCLDDEDCIDGRCQRPWLNEPPSGVDCTLATVYFAFDQAVIREDARATLVDNAACIRKVSADRGVIIFGHTDVEGTEEYNIALAERRARSVADYLSRLGIDGQRLRVVAKGEGEPTGNGAERDRRVEFTWQ